MELGYGNMRNFAEVEKCWCSSALEESIQKLLHQQAACDKAKWSIYRVPKPLLYMNYKAYIPEVITIGPFHHYKKESMATQALKPLSLNAFLHRTKLKVGEIVAKAKSWEKEARCCYAQHIDMNSNDFVEMMILDGCFIVELLIKINTKSQPCDDQTHLPNNFNKSFNAMWYDMYHDLTMLENQLPFFVVQALFDLIPPSHKQNLDATSFTKLMAKLSCNNGRLIGQEYELPSDVLQQNVAHLLHLLRFFYVPTSGTAEEYHENKMEENACGIHIFPPTLTQLDEAGVKVKKATNPKGLLDIRFKNGVLEIPAFEIHDDFESCMRNLLAFEHYHVEEDSEKYVLHYLSFLDGLISTKEDVAFLVKERIMINFIGGSREEASKIFNNLCKYNPNPSASYYNRISKKLHAHCKKWWQRSMATLKRDYFNTPWSYISFVAATFLIILTFLQTLFSII